MTKEELKKAKAKAKAEHEERMRILARIQNLMISDPAGALELIREELPELPYTGSLGAWGG